MLLSAACILVASMAALPEGVTAKVLLDPAVIPFHYPAHYTVVLEVPANTAVQLPSMIGRFDGLDARPHDRKEEILADGRVRISDSYSIEAIFLGNYAIQPATIVINGSEFAVPSPVLHVRELTDEEIAAAEDFHAALPEFDPALVAPFWRRGWFWTTALAAVALSSVCAAVFLRRRRPAAQGPNKSAWEIALSRLQALRARELAEHGEFDRYYVDLSAILRYYIEARFNLHAPERTTQEFLKEMADAGLFDDPQQLFLASFLKHCDYVKFARLESNSDEMFSWFNQVSEFVTQTIPAPPADQAEAA